METKDDLQTIFKNIESVHPEVDFEDVIMQKIELQAKVEKQIIKNRRYGLLGVFVTLILIIIFVWFYNDPNLSVDFKNPLMQIGICSFVLILLFIQLETASSQSKQRFMNDS